MKPRKTPKKGLLVRLRGISERFQMAAKTYLPTLLHVLERVCDYITKYRLTILKNLPEGSAPLLDAVIVACAALTAVINITEGE